MGRKKKQRQKEGQIEGNIDIYNLGMTERQADIQKEGQIL